MVGVIRMALLELWGWRVKTKLQNDKSLPTVGFEPGAFRFRNERATTALRGLMSVRDLKFTGYYLSVLFLEFYL